TVKNTLISASGGIDTTGFARAASYLLSFNQTYATGTARLYGDYQLSGSTLTLDYASQLYTSTATTPKLMRGTSHSATVNSTNDAYAVSQLISVTYSGSDT